MRIAPALIRVLLILALIANGATSAFAATQMQISHLNEKAAEAEAPKSAQSSVPPCHEHAATIGVSIANAEAAVVDKDSRGANTRHGSLDCCKSAKCLCACMHHVAATSASVHFLAANVDHASSVRPLKMGHAAPALPPLIRPPIG